MHTHHTVAQSLNLDVQSDWPPIEGTVDCIDTHRECNSEKLKPCLSLTEKEIGIENGN